MGTLNDEYDAVGTIQLHFERFHNDFLPFGITNDEALALLKKTKLFQKSKDSSSSNLYPLQTIFDPNQRKNPSKTHKKLSFEEKSAKECVFC